MTMRWMPKLAANAALLIGLGLSGISCTELQLLESGVCGNFVIDPGEDCDGHPLEKGTACVASNQPNACRHICNESTVCPTGWGCGVDGICRRPKGAFERYGNPVPFATPNQMYTADFDEDGATDILLLGHENAIGTRPARVAYSEPNDHSVDLRILNLNMFSPVLGEADDDGGFLDVAFATQDGISLLRGSSARDTEFSVFPHFNAPTNSILRMIATDVFAEVPGDELMAFIEETKGITALQTVQESGNQSLLELPFGIDAFAGNVQQGRFDANAPCNELVFAQRGSRDIFLFSPCRTDGTSGWNTSAVLNKVSLPPGFTVDTGVMLADLDLDGHLDMLIETNAVPHVAWGMGTGAFQSEKGGGATNAAGPYALPDLAQAEFPLAIADVNGDAKVDFLLPHSFIVSHDGTYMTTYENIGGAWSAGIIADLNANGWLDVVAASSETIDCTFLNNAGDGVFNAATLATEGTVAFLATGDYDGDLVNDLAVIETFPNVGTEFRSLLRVGFGKAYGPPETLRTLGALDKVAQLSIAQVRDSQTHTTTPDAIDDLIVVDEHLLTENESTMFLRHALVFRGNGSRVLYTSRPLINEAAHALPIAITIAKFANEAPEITALGADHDSDLLRFWTIEGAEADIARAGPPLPTGFHSATNSDELSFRYGAVIATGDLTGDGTDEVVAIAPHGTTQDGAALVIGDFDETSDAFVPRAAIPFSARITVDTRFALEDLDADGHLDGVLSTGTYAEPGPLLVFWGDGSGNLAAENPEIVQVPGGIGGFTCVFEADGCHLFVVSSSGTYSAAARGNRHVGLTTVPNLPPAAQITAGDFNADGLTDLALHTENGLEYYRSVPVNP